MIWRTLLPVAESVRGERFLFLAAVAVGIVLRVVQYSADTSLWLDELALANNIVSRDVWDLVVRPLDFAQVAPPGFLVFEKLIVLAAGPSGLALRLWSFVMGCAAVPLAGAVATRTIGREYAWSVALIAALAPPLIFQSAQVKPYSSDVAIALLLIWLALRDSNTDMARPSRAQHVVALAAPWVSLPATFVVAAVGLIWTGRAISTRNSADRTRTFVAVISWALGCIGSLAWVKFHMTATTSTFMAAYWAHGFAPHPLQISTAGVWLVDSLAGIVRVVAGGYGGRLLVALAAVGVWSLARRSSDRALTLTLPILIAVAAAFARQYPIAERTAMWLGPIVLILGIAGAADLTRTALQRVMSPRWNRLVSYIPVAAVIVPVYATLSRPPVVQRIQEVKPVLRHIVARSQPGDVLYVHFAAFHAATFYAKLLRHPSLTIAQGTCSTTDRRGPLHEIDALRSHPRIWVLFSHLERTEESDLIIGYLDALGTRKETVSVPEPFPGTTQTSSAVLYQLDPRKLANLPDAANWAVPSHITASPRRGCWPPMIPPSLVS